MNDLPSVLTGGALAVILLREVFAFLKTRKNGNGNGNGNGGLSAKDIGEMLGVLHAMREDLQHVREHGHKILNAIAAGQGATELLLDRLDRDDRRGRH